MGFQIDYLPVGNGERSGDAIALRYGNLHGNRSEQTVVIIDGGTLESGEELVNHVINVYNTDTVDYVFSTHLDSDHLSGLRIVLEKLNVNKLYMHIPWEHIDNTSDKLADVFTDENLEEELKESFDLVHEIEELAFSKGVPIEEPFTGTEVNDNIVIMGPSNSYYEQLLLEFRGSPDPKKSALESLYEFTKEAAESFASWVEDSFDIDLFDDNGKTSAENNSSVILLFFLDGHKLLFTGDAGVNALIKVIEVTDAIQLNLDDLRFLHAPHHGSRHNVGKTILERIKSNVVYISATGATKKHPSQRVINAFIKKGSRVYVTRKQFCLHHFNDPDRGWAIKDSENFMEKFEE